MPVSTILSGLLVLLAAIPLWPQTDAPEAQSGPSMSVGVGVGGFSQHRRPSTVRVTISTPVLIAGRIRVTGSEVVVSRPVEVPAGSEQTYTLTLPPLPDGSSLTVDLLDGEGERVMRSEEVKVRLPPGDEMVVAVIGDEDLIGTLGRVRAVVTGDPVAAFALSDLDLHGLAVVDYVILTRQADAAVEEALQWVRSGGNVVADASLISDMDLEVVSSGQGVERASLGAGSLLVVEDLAGRSAEEWSRILRPTVIQLPTTEEVNPEQSSLLSAASEAGGGQVPALPWLLIAVIGFAVVVGPVNFIVLSRLGKRDLAWVTIPTISVLSMMGFWVAGRQNIAGTAVTHASIVISGSNTTARSAVLVTAGPAGDRQISFEGSSTVYPERSFFGSRAVELKLEGDGGASVELPQLGFVGVGVIDEAPELALPQLSADEGRLAVRNTSGLSYWGWGLMSGSWVSVSDTDLAPGETGELQMPAAEPGDFGWNFADALINRRGLWEDRSRSNGLWSLSQAIAEEADPSAIYFIGVTDDYQPPVNVAGARGPEGTTLVAVEVGRSQESVSTSANAEVVSTGFVSWASTQPVPTISTDELTVRFQLPDPGLEARLIDAGRFGIPPGSYEAWMWDEDGFVAITPGEVLPADAVSPEGEVYVRLVGANDFGDNPMSPADLTLEWGT